MLLSLLKLLRPDAKKVAWTQAVIIVVILTSVWRQHEANRLQGIALVAAQEALKHPATTQVSSEARIVRPTRIVTIVKYIPATGEQTTQIDEMRFGEETWKGESAESKPVPLDTLIGTSSTPPAPVRTDRWLAGVSNQSLTFKQIDHYTAWGGYSFRNRFDALAGLTLDEKPKLNLLAVVRF